MLNHQRVFCIARDLNPLPHQLLFLQNKKLHLNSKNYIILLDSILVHIFFRYCVSARENIYKKIHVKYFDFLFVFSAGIHLLVICVMNDDHFLHLGVPFSIQFLAVLHLLGQYLLLLPL